MRRVRHLTLTASLAALSLALAGCIANPLDQLVDNAVEGGVEGLIERELGEDVDISLPGQGGGGELPSSWPSDVPTPAGDVVFSVATPGNWTASILVSGADAIDRIYAEFERAGFVLDTEANFGGMATRTYKNDTYLVSVSAITDDPEAVTVQYVIVEEGVQ